MELPKLTKVDHIFHLNQDEEEEVRLRTSRFMKEIKIGNATPLTPPSRLSRAMVLATRSEQAVSHDWFQMNIDKPGEKLVRPGRP